MSGIGRVTLSQATGRPTRVSADGYPEWLPVGATIAWGAISASSGETLSDGTYVASGEKAIRYGTIMVPITTAEVQTVTIDATGGTWNLSVTYGGSTQTASGLAWDISAADLVAAVEDLTNVGEGRVSITLSSLVYTITFAAIMGDVAIMTTTDSLTGGAGTATVANVTAGIATGGMWAPYDSSLTNGRQLLTPGSVGIMDVTIKDSESTVMGANLNNYLTGLITGGLVWRERLVVDGTNQPTLGDLLDAMPRLRLTPAE